jgi:hypothetical protein
MGINFIKQFVAAGMSKDIQLIVPLWGSDQDIIRAVGDPMLGLFSVGHWSIDLDNPANRKFVAEFEKEYKRLPTSTSAGRPPSLPPLSFTARLKASRMSMPIEAFGPDSVLMNPTFTLSAAFTANAPSIAIPTNSFLILPPD